MLHRKENGKLSLSSLDLDIFLEDLFEICNTEKEVIWLFEQLESYIDITADDRIRELEDNEYAEL